jgi:hypothetical protein
MSALSIPHLDLSEDTYICIKSVRLGAHTCGTEDGCVLINSITQCLQVQGLERHRPIVPSHLGLDSSA